MKHATRTIKPCVPRVCTRVYPQTNPCSIGWQPWEPFKGSELNFTARKRMSALSDQLDAANVFLYMLVMMMRTHIRDPSPLNHGQVY